MENPQRDIFAEIFALLTPEALFANENADGRGVSVCVIDSGIDQNRIEQEAAKRNQQVLPIQGGIFTTDQAEPLPYDGRHSTPHGTTVADIILSIAPKVQLYSADVFGPQGSCDVEVVMKALHWAVNVWQCKIINLSLGVTEQRLQQIPRRYQFLRAIEEGYFKDALIFAAAHNDHPLTRSYPAGFAPPLISVDKHVFASPLEFRYALKNQIEFEAHAKGYFGPFAQEPATSWAAPHLAGIAAKLLSLRPGLKPFEVKTILYWLSLNRT